MMARQVARHFCRLGEVHSLVYGCRASGENGHKLTASTRVGLESRLTDYPGLNLICLVSLPIHVLPLNLIEYSTVCEMRLLCFLPAAENFIDAE